VPLFLFNNAVIVSIVLSLKQLQKSLISKALNQIGFPVFNTVAGYGPLRDLEAYIGDISFMLIWGTFFIILLTIWSCLTKYLCFVRIHRRLFPQFFKVAIRNI